MFTKIHKETTYERISGRVHCICPGQVCYTVECCNGPELGLGLWPLILRAEVKDLPILTILMRGLLSGSLQYCMYNHTF